MRLSSFVVAALILCAACLQQGYSQPTNRPVTVETLTVSAAEVNAFIPKWKARFKKDGWASARDLMQETNAVAKVLGALEREPVGPWSMYLEFLMDPRAGVTNNEIALKVWKKASESLTTATQKSPQNADAAAALLLVNQSLAKALLEAGNTSEAAAVAEDLLRKNRPD